MITAIAASWQSITERAPLYYAFLLALQTGLLGLFASLDVVLFYIFFEFTLIPLFFLIGLWGGPQRRRAAVTFFLYTLAGSLLTLLGVIALVVVHYQHSQGNVLTFSIPELTKGLADTAVGRVAEHRLLDQPAGADLPAASGRASRSRCRCFRSTPGCRWLTSRPRRPGRSCWPASCSRWGATASCDSTSA